MQAWRARASCTRVQGGKTDVSVRCIATITASLVSSSQMTKFYDGLLADLKRKEGPAFHSNQSYYPLHAKSFNEINADSMHFGGSQPLKEEPWTSLYDSVTRSPYARDVGHLEVLLDALITNRNFERAENILRAIQPLLSNPLVLIDHVNKFLEVYSQEENVSESDVADFINEIPHKFSALGGIQPNARTYAILLRKLNSPVQVIKRLHLQKPELAKRIFHHIDVLGEGLVDELLAHPDMRSEYLPRQMLELFNEAVVQRQQHQEEVLEEAFANPNVSVDRKAAAPTTAALHTTTGDLTEAKHAASAHAAAVAATEITTATADLPLSPVLDKDATELLAVDAFGLKVIRQTLLGLNAESKSLQDFINSLEQDFEMNILSQKDSHKRDYFEIYKSLKTSEQREKFNEVLNIFNEEREKLLELRGLDAAKEKWRHEFEIMKDRGTILVHKSLNVQLFDWYSKLLPLVKREVEECTKVLDDPDSIIAQTPSKGPERDTLKDRLFYAPYLTLVPPEKMCVIAILEILKLNSTGGVVDGMRTARAVVSVGRALELEYKLQKLLKVEGKSLNRKVNRKNTNELKKYIQKRRDVRESSSLSIDTSEWTGPIYAKTGELLTRLLMHVATVTVRTKDPTTGETVVGQQPAFHHTFQFINGQKLGVLKIHKELLNQLAGEKLQSVQPQLLPMLVKPRPWTNYSDGGYLYSQSYLVRIKDSPESIAYLKASLEKGHLNEIYRGLNVLGETAWTVNRKMFEVISAKWNTGKKFLDIPDIGKDPELPPVPPRNADPGVKRDYQRVAKKLLNEAASARSQRCDANYKLEIARAFLGEKLYFPHNVDFRGRAYPLSPHFNHLGGDMTRSLFLFWEGKELGPKGLEWLKIHMANLSGLDKAPLDERIRFTNENMDNILELARNPLSVDPQTGENNGWWLKAEKPWQALSVCLEINEAYKMKDPTKYVSHIPVHQDGTCNGLQHYAALGGDIEGARQVNLLPSDRPQDVYKFVASLVQKRIDLDVLQGDQYAIFMQDKITRKVVKQTVMTNVYGVTFVGAVAQIEKQIEHHFSNEQVSANLPGQVARYLALHVFASMRELFEGAHQIQDWLGVCARRISKSISIDYEETPPTGRSKIVKNKKPDHLSSVIWTTPLGLPCVQPYRTIKKQVIATNLQDIVISDPFGAAPVDARKQQTAFPPNFVHSLDATHMLMTSKACGNEGISFASVHDSYWTHASDIDKMNAHCRAQFIKLHEDNLVEKLRNEFEKRYKGCLQVIHILTDHPVAIKVKDVRKKLSDSIGRAVTVADEIYLEKSRQMLLSSEDPSRVKMGQEMVTTISVTEGADVEEQAVLAGSSKSIQILVLLQFPAIPVRGELDIEEIKKSKYFFS